MFSRFTLRAFVDHSGSVAAMAPFAFAGVVAVAAFAVDIGSLHYEKRRIQSAADLAAIAAARDLPRARDAATAALIANGFEASALRTLTLGRYLPDPSLPPEERFEEVRDVRDADAARVTLARAAPLIFGSVTARIAQHPDPVPPDPADRPPRGAGQVTIHASATASRSAQAAFGVGSRLASLHGGAANAVLGTLIGSEISLDVMDYRALADVRVDLFDFSESLARSAHLRAGTYDEVIESDPYLDDALAALGASLDASSRQAGTAARAIDRLSGAASNGRRRIDLTEIIDFGPEGFRSLGDRPSITVEASALSMLSVLAQLANGDHIVEADIALDAGPLANAHLAFTIGERARETGWITVGSEGAEVHTAQTRLLLEVEVAGAGPLAQVRVPLYLELASATARLHSVSCSRTAQVAIEVAPAPAELWIGEPRGGLRSDLSGRADVRHAELVRVGRGVRVMGLAHTRAASEAGDIVRFSAREIDDGVVKTVSSRAMLGSAVSTLVADLDIEARLGGLSVNTGPVNAVGPALAAAAAPLDLVLEEMLSTLGVGLGEADVWVTGVRCGGARLVQ